MPGVRDVPLGQQQTSQADGHVHQEDRAPAEAVNVGRNQQPAEHLAEDRRESACCTVPAERPGPALTGGRSLDGGEDLRHHHRRRRALRDAPDDEEGGSRRESAGQRGEREGRHAQQEQALAADAVAQPATEHQEQRVRGGVARHHELEQRLARPQVAVDGRECDVHDEEVDHWQQDADQDDCQAS